jgi:hypothetical protein
MFQPGLSSRSCIRLVLSAILTVSLGGAKDGFEKSGLKTKLPNSSLIIGKDSVEFEPSVTEWKSAGVERWHISY